MNFIILKNFQNQPQKSTLVSLSCLSYLHFPLNLVSMIINHISLTIFGIKKNHSDTNITPE